MQFQMYKSKIFYKCVVIVRYAVVCEVDRYAVVWRQRERLAAYAARLSLSSWSLLVFCWRTSPELILHV